MYSFQYFEFKKNLQKLPIANEFILFPFVKNLQNKRL